MATLLVIIYLAFISLGLPDALLGSAWPAIYPEISAPLPMAGLISLTVTGGTVVSSLLSDRMIRRFGTGRVTMVSVLLTATALLGNSLSPSVFWLCVCAVPLGLGAGSVDAALNGFVSLHYEARHMNWMHCFWGLGASMGPVILSWFLAAPGGWRKGYLTVAIIQFVLTAVLILSLPLWKKAQEGSMAEDAAVLEPVPMKKLIRLPGALATLFTFLVYCAAELTAGLWGSTFLVEGRGLPLETAATCVSLYYLGITVGRIVSGFLSNRVTSGQLVRWGALLSIVGGATLFVDLPLMAPLSFSLLGLGLAPIFPTLIHATPARFGRDVSQSFIGLQMAMAYIGNTIFPPLFGIIVDAFDVSVLPLFLVVLLVIMLFLSQRAGRLDKIRKESSDTPQ